MASDSESSSPGSDIDPAEFWKKLWLHQGMIQDRLRTSAYCTAIERIVKPEHLVLDLGCGLGILSFFAARKGCRKVHALEISPDLVKCARALAEANGLGSCIQFVEIDALKYKTRLKFDVLIHEQIGSMVWDEDMVTKTAYIRDRFLKKDGKLIPSRLDLYLVPVDFESALERSLSFWGSKPYGFDFSSIKPLVFKQEYAQSIVPMLVELHDSSTFLCREKRAHSVDFETAVGLPPLIELNFSIARKGMLRGICGFFKIYTDETQMISTRPRQINTSWKQIFLPCFEAQMVTEKSKVHVSIEPRVRPRDWKFEITVR